MLNLKTVRMIMNFGLQIEWRLDFVRASHMLEATPMREEVSRDSELKAVINGQERLQAPH